MILPTMASIAPSNGLIGLMPVASRFTVCVAAAADRVLTAFATLFSFLQGVMVAVAGFGRGLAGRGIRLVHTPERFAAA
jgi:hypothetical protein